MTNLFDAYFQIITTKQKNTTEKPFNVKSITKKNKTHPSQSIIFFLMLRAKRRSNIYQFDSLSFDSIGTRGEHANQLHHRYGYMVDMLIIVNADTLDIQFCAYFDILKK